MFLTGAAIKIVVLVSWHTTASLCSSNDLQLDTQKDALFLKMLLCFRFFAFGFEAIPHSICNLAFIVDETYLGSVVAAFSVQLCRFLVTLEVS